MENKINIACFKEGSRTAEVKDIWQWDYGQILRIQGLNLPTAVEIHFSLDEHGGEAARRIGVTKDGVTDVVVPDTMLENESAYGDSYYFFAYIYLTDETSGNTEYKIRAKVSTRSKPEGYVSGGNDTFAEILKTVNEIAEDKVDVPAPAKVGQVLAVKATDESGKPTEFEAKDMSGGVSDEKIAEAVGTYMEAHPIEETDPTVPEWAKQPEKPRYTASEVGALPDTTKIPSKTSDLQNDSGFTALALDETLTDNTKAAPAGMVGELKGDLEQIMQNGTGTGLTLEQINLFDSVFNHIYYIDDEGGTIADELIASLKASLPVTLVSISATYSGGYVTEGTNVNDLTDIVVTATYSDDSTKEVTEYTLSGVIVAGNNTITVTYKGLTTTFIVKGTEIEQDGLYPFENGTWSSANGNTVTISDGKHVVINKTYSEELWMSLTKCSKTSTLVTYANLYNNFGTSGNYTIPASANVLLKIYNIENNNGLNFRVGANQAYPYGFKVTNLDTKDGVYTDEASLNVTFEEEIKLAGIFCHIAKDSLGTLSFDVNLTVNGERWV